MVSPSDRRPAGRATQIDALHMAADWVAAHPTLPIGEISVRPGGAVQIHLQTFGSDDAAVALRALAATQPAAGLRVSEVHDLSPSRRGRRLQLHVPVPGIEMELWCFETVPSVPPAVQPSAACTRPARRMTVG